MVKTCVDRPFVGIPSFLRSPVCADLNQLTGTIAVMGVPFDEGSPYLAGSRMAPRMLREHSLRFVGEGSQGFYNPETAKQYLKYEMANGQEESVGGSQRDGNRVMMMSEFRRLKPAGIANVVPANAACHVSIDVDVLDISIVSKWQRGFSCLRADRAVNYEEASVTC